MSINNKVLGSNFEKDFCEYLNKQGYFVIYNEGAAYTKSQPCDIVAIKNNKPVLIDCKTLNNKTGLFNLTRLEENQRLAYKKYIKCGNKKYLLAILFNNNLYYINLNDINFNEKSINILEKGILQKEHFRKGAKDESIKFI